MKRPFFVALGAQLVGPITFGDHVSIWYNAVVRSDDHIAIGSNTNIQDNCVLHGEKDHPVIIGKNVTIGHGAIVHGCTISNNTLIGMGTIILNGAQIGSNCIIGAGALVTENTIIPDHSLVIGSPAKVKRQITSAEEQEILASARHYVEEAIRLS